VTANDVDPLPVLVEPLGFVPLNVSEKLNVPVMMSLPSVPVNARVCVESTVPGPRFAANVCADHVTLAVVEVTGAV
jgi:hypothetical protein